jgi:hypothetical protein
LKEVGSSIVAGQPNAKVMADIGIRAKSTEKVLAKTKTHRTEGMDNILQSCQFSSAKPCQDSVKMARESEDLNVSIITYASKEYLRALNVLKSDDKAGLKLYGQEMINGAAPFEKRAALTRELRGDTVKLITKLCTTKI